MRILSERYKDTATLESYQDTRNRLQAALDALIPERKYDPCERSNRASHSPDPQGYRLRGYLRPRAGTICPSANSKLLLLWWP